MVVFSNDSKGNVPPKRILHTAHRIYNLAVDEEKEELFATIEYPSEVMVYDKHMGERTSRFADYPGIEPGWTPPTALP